MKRMFKNHSLFSCVATSVLRMRLLQAVALLVGSNQNNYFENATACSKLTLKTTVATQLKGILSPSSSLSLSFSFNKSHSHSLFLFPSISLLPIYFLLSFSLFLSFEPLSLPSMFLYFALFFFNSISVSRSL
jgi:hypothetical protein